MEGKYGALRNGWDVQEVSYKTSAIWKGILFVKENFMKTITYRVGSGEKILFWKDNWIGARPLANQFPDLCSCVVDKNAKVKCYLSFSGEQKVWIPILRRNLMEHEVGQLISLLNQLSGGIHCRRWGGIRLWKASKDGSFSVSSFFSSITRSNMRNPMVSIWKLKAPTRVVVFGWRVLRKIILTMENLRRRGKVVVNGCPMCLSEEETMDHLLLNCKVAQML